MDISPDEGRVGASGQGMAGSFRVFAFDARRPPPDAQQDRRFTFADGCEPLVIAFQIPVFDLSVVLVVGGLGWILSGG